MLEKLNIAIFELINHFAGINPILDEFVKIIANYLPLAFIFCLLYLWFKKSKYQNIVLFSIYSAILGLLLNLITASFYYHPRPFMIPVGKLLIPHAPDTSFPSDHTTFMLSIAFMFIYFKEMRILGLILTIFGLIGGFARIFCGLHFPLDIVGSCAISVLSSLSIHLLQNRLKYLNEIIVSLYAKIMR